MQESYKILLRHIKSETNEHLRQFQKDRYLIWSFSQFIIFYCIEIQEKLVKVILIFTWKNNCMTIVKEKFAEEFIGWGGLPFQKQK